MRNYRSSVTINDFHFNTKNYFQGKSVLVTGGSGFIGSHIVEQLILLGAKPIIITRQKNPPFLQSILEHIELRRCDLADYKKTLNAMQGAQVVLNLAAEVAGIEYNSQHPATIFQNNLTVFFNVIRAAQQVGVERFLVTSSACVYPRHCSIPTPEEEGFLSEPEPTNSGYGWAKRMEEYMGVKVAQEFGMSVAIARPYNAYGPRDDFHSTTSHVIPALIVKAFTTEDGVCRVWGDGSHSRSFLYVDDFSRGLLEVAARYPAADPVNIGALEEVSIADLAKKICKIVAEIRGIDITPVFEKQGLTGQPRRCCDTTKISSLLGYRVKTTLDEGLLATIKWFQYENRSLFVN